MYINCCAKGENGIPPGGSVTITLPLYSPLVASIDPKEGGPMIEWWQGGGINIFRSPDKRIVAAKGAAGSTGRRTKTPTRVKPKKNPPACAGCNLHFFIAPASIVNEDPQQLIEYTLGAATD